MGWAYWARFPLLAHQGSNPRASSAPPTPRLADRPVGPVSSLTDSRYSPLAPAVAWDPRSHPAPPLVSEPRRHDRVLHNPGTQRHFRGSLDDIRLRFTLYSSVNPSFLSPSSHPRHAPLLGKSIAAPHLTVVNISLYSCSNYSVMLFMFISRSIYYFNWKIELNLRNMCHHKGGMGRPWLTN
jgi:hypothetical protein